jgi:hypothetical protein
VAREWREKVEGSEGVEEWSEWSGGEWRGVSEEWKESYHLACSQLKGEGGEWGSGGVE